MSGRFYQITLTPPDALGSTDVLSWSSHSGNNAIPSAQNVNFAIHVTSAAQPAGAMYITIEGVPIYDLSQARGFYPIGSSYWGITVSAGMLGGLPLSSSQPAAGVILNGMVLGSFGNWIETSMSLSFIVTAGQPYSLSNPANLVFNWPKGTLLSDALRTMLTIAYPTASVNISITDTIATYQATHRSSTLDQMASYILQLTHQYAGSNSQGVNIVLSNNLLSCFDGSVPFKQAISIRYADLVGQPVWISAVVIQLRVIMRADISIGDEIILPAVPNLPGIVTKLPTLSNAFGSYGMLFQGTFTVIRLQHIGDFRSTDGRQWITIIDAVNNLTGELL